MFMYKYNMYCIWHSVYPGQLKMAFHDRLQCDFTPYNHFDKSRALNIMYSIDQQKTCKMKQENLW